MGLHYNAFISYRHNERDSLAAGTIQRELERFRIPAEIRRRTGINRIDRIFRDKEELTITSDLGENIRQALAESDHLIVICSPELKESRWCMLEIETFLSMRGRDRILTVVTEGEPEEVIPEVLQQQVGYVAQEDGSETEVIRKIEPLACDYRQAVRDKRAMRRANREELPRLAAALLGCAYDELVRRQQQYRMRRLGMIAGTAAVLMSGAISYLLWSRAAIRDQYRQTLRSQAVNLAGQSEALLEADDRVRALQLALAALPDEAVPERPVTQEALGALTDALRAYEVSDRAVSTWLYSARNEIRSMALSEGGRYLLALDEMWGLTVYDTESREQLEVWKIGGGEDVPDFLPVGETDAVVWQGNSLFSMDYVRGEQNWAWTLGSAGIHVLPLDGGRSLLAENRHTLLIMDAATGDILDEYEQSEEEAETGWLDGDRGMAVSPSGNRVAVMQRAYLDESQETESTLAAAAGMRVAVWDRQAGTMQFIEDVSLAYGEKLAFFGEDHLVICARNDAHVSGESLEQRETVTLTEDPLQIFCASFEDGVWRGTFRAGLSYTQEPVKILLEEVPAPQAYTEDRAEPAGGDRRAMAVVCGDALLVLDPAEGHIFCDRRINGNTVRIVSAQVHCLRLLTREGAAVEVSYAPPGVTREKVYAGGISDAVLPPGAGTWGSGTEIYVLRNGEICYYSPQTNPHYRRYADRSGSAAAGVRSSAVSGDHLAILLQDASVLLADTRSGQTRMVRLEGKGDEWLMAGDSAQQDSFLLIRNESGNGEYHFYTLTRDAILTETARTAGAGLGDSGFSLSAGFFLQAGHAFSVSAGGTWMAAQDDGHSLLVLRDGKLHRYPLEELPEEYSLIRAYRQDLIRFGTLNLPSPVWADHSGIRLLFTACSAGTGENRTFLAEPETGRVIALEDTPREGLVCAAWNEDDSRVAVTGDFVIEIFDAEGRLQARIPHSGRQVISLHWLGESLWVIYKDHAAVSYTAEGRIVNETALLYEDDLTGLAEQISWETEGTILYLRIDNELNILDTVRKASRPEARVRQAAGYVPQTGAIVTLRIRPDGLAYEAGAFTHLTPAELIGQGREELGGREPDEEMKARYGLP